MVWHRKKSLRRLLWIICSGLLLHLFYLLLLDKSFGNGNYESEINSFLFQENEELESTTLTIDYLQQFYQLQACRNHNLMGNNSSPSSLVSITEPLRLMKCPIVNQKEFSSTDSFEQLHFLQGSRNPRELYHTTHLLNDLQIILNEDFYNETEHVIVVQVHKRLAYLKLLVESFQRSKGISKALLIFSHDFFDAQVNQLIRSIHFCKVLQIFFPYSQQIFEKIFPGSNPKDCSRNMNRAQAEKIGCINFRWADTYGHYREGPFCQIKHHWFWKANFVFNEVRAIRNFDGPLLFLEEDHYVAEDFLHVLHLMWRERERNYRNSVDLLALGTYNEGWSNDVLSVKVLVDKWRPTQRNLDLALSRNTWENITSSCGNQFCLYDDYNWDWSLRHVSRNCLSRNLQIMLVVDTPRVFHIGICGVHHNASTFCSPDALIHRIQNKISEKSSDILYPDQLNILDNISNATALGPMKPNGGWNDRRDHHLCLSFIVSNSSSVWINETLLSDQPDISLKRYF